VPVFAVAEIVALRGFVLMIVLLWGGTDSIKILQSTGCTASIKSLKCLTWCSSRALQLVIVTIFCCICMSGAWIKGSAEARTQTTRTCTFVASCHDPSRLIEETEPEPSGSNYRLRERRREQRNPERHLIIRHTRQEADNSRLRKRRREQRNPERHLIIRHTRQEADNSRSAPKENLHQRMINDTFQLLNWLSDASHSSMDALIRRRSPSEANKQIKKAKKTQKPVQFIFDYVGIGSFSVGDYVSETIEELDSRSVTILAGPSFNLSDTGMDIHFIVGASVGETDSETRKADPVVLSEIKGGHVGTAINQDLSGFNLNLALTAAVYRAFDYMKYEKKVSGVVSRVATDLHGLGRLGYRFDMPLGSLEPYLMLRGLSLTAEKRAYVFIDHAPTLNNMLANRERIILDRSSLRASFAGFGIKGTCKPKVANSSQYRTAFYAATAWKHGFGDLTLSKKTKRKISELHREPQVHYPELARDVLELELGLSFTRFIERKATFELQESISSLQEARNRVTIHSMEFEISYIGRFQLDMERLNHKFAASMFLYFQ